MYKQYILNFIMAKEKNIRIYARKEVHHRLKVLAAKMGYTLSDTVQMLLNKYEAGNHNHDNQG
jgi:macrodomain Ter protein organizer (MatP/YcbG family)